MEVFVRQVPIQGSYGILPILSIFMRQVSVHILVHSVGMAFV